MNKKMMAMDDDIENVGIMQGFMDSMADEDEGDDESDPEEKLERRPDTPEILMNNLRGDMRSIEARRDELADMVGYQAATETPESVLAMLQPVLAQQGGIGALPQSGPMAQGPQAPMMGGAPGMPPSGMPPVPADMGAPPPGMPPMPPGAGMPPPPQQGGIAELLAGMGGAQGGMPASDQPPVAMARGGLVQNFSLGSDEEGVTPAAAQGPSEEMMMFPPEMVAAARRSTMDLLNRAPTTAPSLEEATMSRLPVLTKLLGPDKNAAEAQLLFDLGQRAFGFAANTDESGRPLKGSFMSRLAGATRTLPAAMGRQLDEISKIDRQLKTLALQQGEKDIDKIEAKNAALENRKDTLLNEVLRAQAKIEAKKIGATGKEAAPFGKSSSGRLLQILSEGADAYKNGTMTPEAERNYEAAATEYTQTKRTVYKDDRGFDVVLDQGNKLPPFVASAFNARKPGSVPDSMIANQFGSSTGVATPLPPQFASNQNPSVAPMPSATQGPSVAPMPSATQNPERPVTNIPPPMTIFGVADLVSGIGPGLQQLGSKIPGVGGDISPEQQRARSFLNTSKKDLVQALQNSPQFAQMERIAIEEAVDIDPKVLDSTKAFENRAIGIDEFLQGVIAREEALAKNAPTAADRNKLEASAAKIASFRTLFGVPPKINTKEEFDRAPPGRYQVLDPVTGKYVVTNIR